MTQKAVNDIQSGYDRIADEYVRRIYDELQHKPFDRSRLDRFADSVNHAGLVCDLACGPGHVARYLHERGMQVYGMDLSEGMLQRARQLNPGIRFEQGDMRNLPVGDESWAGIAAFYAIVNLSPAEVAKAFHEMKRVLKPGGRLLVAFHLGEDVSQVEDDIWNCGVSLEFTFYRLSTILKHLRQAGLMIEEVTERDPYPEVEYQSRRAYIFAHKPPSANYS